MRIVIFLGQNAGLANYDLSNSYIIGVDKGALMLSKAGIGMDLAVGDFDSISIDEYNLVLKYAKGVERLNPIKDDTDTEHALKMAYAMSNDITIIGGLNGNRIEHLFANAFLLKDYPFVSMIDDYSSMMVIDRDYVLEKSDYKFISLFPFEDINISLNGFKYDLNNYKLSALSTLGVSNEIIENKASIKIDGKCLLICSKNDTIL